MREYGCMRALLSLAIAAALLAAGTAQAQQLDLASARCKEFVDGSRENALLIVMWLQGYYSEENAAPVVDFEKMKANSGKIGEYCRKYPGHSISTAAEKVMGN